MRKVLTSIFQNYYSFGFIYKITFISYDVYSLERSKVRLIWFLLPYEHYTNIKDPHEIYECNYLICDFNLPCSPVWIVRLMCYIDVLYRIKMDYLSFIIVIKEEKILVSFFFLFIDFNIPVSINTKEYLKNYLS